MKAFFSRINSLLAHHQQRWYFLPAFGIFFLVIMAGSIFGYQTFKARPQEIEEEITENSPDPTPKGQVAGFSDIIDDQDLEEFEEIGNPPSPTPTLTPTPTPKPTPTPLTKEEVDIALPENNHTYDETDIKFQIEARVNQPVYKMELILNGVIKQSFDSTKTIDTTIDLDPGVYMLIAKAYLSDSSTLESTTYRFSTGGKSLDEPTPTPTTDPNATSSGSTY